MRLKDARKLKEGDRIVQNQGPEPRQGGQVTERTRHSLSIAWDDGLHGTYPFVDEHGRFFCHQIEKAPGRNRPMKARTPMKRPGPAGRPNPGKPGKPPKRDMLDKWASLLPERRAIAKFWEWIGSGSHPIPLNEIDAELDLDRYHGIDRTRLRRQARSMARWCARAGLRETARHLEAVERIPKGKPDTRETSEDAAASRWRILSERLAFAERWDALDLLLEAGLPPSAGRQGKVSRPKPPRAGKTAVETSATECAPARGMI